MDTKNPSIDDFLGILFLRCQDLRPINGYFECIDLIRPLLDTLDSQLHTSGFYINVGAGFNAVRLSYLTNDVKATKKVIQEFLNETSGMTLLGSEEPHRVRFSQNYGGNELSFRRFLYAYTKIGLDLLKFDVLYSRKLVAVYRLTYSPQKISCKPLFEPAFYKHSDYFGQMTVSSQRQLWKDLDFWHPIPNSQYCADWAHMLVNMLLPGDWIYIPEYSDLFLNRNPKQPIRGRRKAEMLERFSLDLPEEWNPNI